MDLKKREQIASDVLGRAVCHGDTMPCLFQELHSHSSGPRDMRVCLTPGAAGELPTFYCFHSSCREAWGPMNKELRRRIWFAENGYAPREKSEWDNGRVAPAPRGNMPSKLMFHPQALRAVQREDWNVTEGWFAERSPVDPARCGAVDFLRHLYRPEEKVLIFTQFKSQGQFMFWHGHGTYRLADKPNVRAVPSELPKGSVEGVWYLCAPVDGTWHVNPRVTNKHGLPAQSRRSQESVTAFRYMVLESDEAEPLLWLNLLAQLPLPIAAIYTSGGKSIHALIKVDAPSKEAWDRYKRVILPLFTKLGADGAAITAVRLTRLPGCQRNGKMQRLLYLNPAPDPHGNPIGTGGNVICGK